MGIWVMPRRVAGELPTPVAEASLLGSLRGGRWERLTGDRPPAGIGRAEALVIQRGLQGLEKRSLLTPNFPWLSSLGKSQRLSKGTDHPG